MITMCVVGKQGEGKSSVIKFFLEKNVDTQCKKIITQYSPPNLQKIIDVAKPKKHSYPQVEFSEITIEEKVQTLTKYSLNIFDILIFVKYLPELERNSVEEECRFLAAHIKNTDITTLNNRAERLQHSLKFKRSEDDAAYLNSLEHLLKMYKNSEPLKYDELDKVSKRIVHSLGLLSFKPINLLINTRYNNLCNKFETILIEGLYIKAFATDFSLYSDLKEESKKNRDIFKEFQVDYIDFSQILMELLKQSGIIHFYTIVSNDIRAWQLQKGTFIKEAAGKIHKDFEKGFISAEVIKADDFITTNGDMKKLKAEGKVILVNKDYQVCDEDIITFKFNV